MKYWTSIYSGVLIAITILVGQDGVEAKTKIIFMPPPTVSSPYFNMLAIAEEMQRRGNEVAIITAGSLKRRKSTVKHIDYEMSNKKSFLDDVNKLTSEKSEVGWRAYLVIAQRALQIEYDSCQDLLGTDETRKAIIQSDFIVAFSATICAIYVADIYGKPFAVVHPGMFPVVGSYAQVPLPPSYVPLSGSEFTEKMSFLERTKNFLWVNVRSALVDAAVTHYYRGMQERFKWKSYERFSRLYARAELYIVSLDFAFEFVHPLMPDVFVVGPLTTKPASKLSEELEDFMQSSGEHGVVLITFGSLAMNIDAAIFKRMAAGISRLKQKVIWKVNAPDGATIPSNLRIAEWLPQNDILGHEKTRAFVSHMGMNGALEAAYHGVPLVAACLLADTFANTMRFVHKAKMAKYIDIYSADANMWHATMQEVIYNTSYKENAMKTSKLMRSWPSKSMERAGGLIQYAIDNGGRLPHLKSYGRNLYWFQYHSIDVILFLLAVVGLGLCISCKMMKIVCGWLFCRKKTKVD